VVVNAKAAGGDVATLLVNRKACKKRNLKVRCSWLFFGCGMALKDNVVQGLAGLRGLL
jgi:hypothetical protein